MSIQSSSHGLAARRRAAAIGVVAILAACGGAQSALVSWNTNSNGAWSTAANWTSNPALPGPLDDVTINRPAAAVTVGISSGDWTINSLALAETIRFSGGTLAVTGGANVTGQISMSGGTLVGGSWTLGTSISMVFEGATTSTLQGVTLNGTLNPGLAFDVRSGLTVNGSLYLNPNAALRSLETQTIDADQIGFISTQFPGALHVATGTTMTLSGSTLVEASAGSRGEVRNLDNVIGGDLVNDGVIRATGANSRFSILNSTFHNNGDIEALSGGIVAIGGTVGDPGSLTEWTNSGDLRVNGGTLVLGGRFDIDPLDIDRTGGNVILSGTLVNTGQTTTLDATSGPWLAGRGVIEGGTLNLGAGGGMLFELAPGLTQAKLTLNDVVVNGDMDLGYRGYLDVRGGLEINGALRSASHIGFLETQTIDVDTMEFFDHKKGYAYNDLADGVTLTIGAGALVQSVDGGGGAFQRADSFAKNVSLVNDGVMRAVGEDSELYIVTDNIHNNGTIEALSGGHVIIGSGYFQTLLPASTFTNAGTLRVDGGELEFGGHYWIDPATIDRTGGTIHLGGFLENEGRIFTLNSATGPWRVAAGQIEGGTVTLVGPNRLQWSSQTASSFRKLSLNGVTLNGVIDLAANNSELFLKNGLTLNGEVRVSGDNSLIFVEGDQTWNGGTFRLSGFNDSSATVQTSGEWTIGADATVTGRGRLTSVAAGSIINQGLILKDTIETLTISPQTFRNDGVMRVTDGRLAVGAQLGWSNTGLIDVLGGEFLLQSQFTNTGTIAKSGGVLALAGTVQNAGGSITMDGVAGSWTLNTGSRIVGGEVNFLNGGRFMFNSSGMVQNATLNGDTSISNGTLLAADNFTMNGKVSFTGTQGTLVFISDSAQRIDTGEYEFAPSFSSNRNEIMLGAGPVTLGEDVVIRGGGTISLSSPYANVGRNHSQAPTTLINEGTIVADRAGQLLALRPNHLENKGVIRAEADSWLLLTNALNHTWSNAEGEIVADGGQVRLGSRVYTADLGLIHSINGGQIYFGGQLMNEGSTFRLDRTTGSWIIASGSNFGEIHGGSIEFADGASLIFESQNARFYGVTLNSDLTISGDAILGVWNDLTLNGVITLAGAGSQLGFSGTQTLDEGTIVFDPTSGGEDRYIAPPGGSGGETIGLTLGENVLIRGGRGRIITSDYNDASILNQGTISADIDGETITIMTANFVNEGTLTSANGGLLAFDGPPLNLRAKRGAGDASMTNTGVFAIDEQGDAQIAGSFTQSNSGSLALAAAGAQESLYASINITQNASLAGALELTFANGFSADWGDQFTLLSAGSISGAFEDVLLPMLDSSLRWWTEQSETQLIVGVRAVADVNRDLVVDFADLNIVLSDYNLSGAGLLGDANEDGSVDFADLNAVLSLYGAAAPRNVVPTPGAALLLAAAAGFPSRRRRR